LLTVGVVSDRLGEIMNQFGPTLLLVLLQLLGGDNTATVRPGDSLTSIGARFGADARVIGEANGLKAPYPIYSGQTLKIENRHIVPDLKDAEIVINVPQRMLFHLGSDGIVHAYPVAAGKASWKTPTGDFTILTMETNPTWEVPVSIQEEMRREGKPVLTRVPPSPGNPLGAFWLGLSLPGIGIHGTNSPASIYSLATHGCIRLHPDDIKTLFTQVSVGTKGRIIDEPLLMVRSGESIFLEVHPDLYRKETITLEGVQERARSGGYLDALDLTAVQDVLKKRDGIARDVTRH
jgi:L,D-transpeptidase ErfK/SrfK